jgi:hypothetical protein
MEYSKLESTGIPTEKLVFDAKVQLGYPFMVKLPYRTPHGTHVKTGLVEYVISPSEGLKDSLMSIWYGATKEKVALVFHPPLWPPDLSPETEVSSVLGCGDPDRFQMM